MFKRSHYALIIAPTKFADRERQSSNFSSCRAVGFRPPPFFLLSLVFLASSANKRTAFRTSSVGPTRDQFFRYTPPVIRFSRFYGENEHRHCLSRALLLFSTDRRRQKKAKRSKKRSPARMHACMWDHVCVRNTRTYTKLSNRLGLADGTVADTHAFPRIHAMSTKNIHARQRARNR